MKKLRKMNLKRLINNFLFVLLFSSCLSYSPSKDELYQGYYIISKNEYHSQKYIFVDSVELRTDKYKKRMHSKIEFKLRDNIVTLNFRVQDSSMIVLYTTPYSDVVYINCNELLNSKTDTIKIYAEDF